MSNKPRPATPPGYEPKDRGEFASRRERIIHDRVWWPLIALAPLWLFAGADWNLLELIGVLAIGYVAAAWGWKGWKRWQQRRDADAQR